MYILKYIDFIGTVDNIMECVAVELKLNKGKHVIIRCTYIELRDQMRNYLMTP